MKQIYTLLSLSVSVMCYNGNANAQCLTAPFTESFDAGTQPSCVLISATTGGPWDFNGISWNTTGCGGTPSDHTGNGGEFASMDHSTPDADVILEFDTIDVSGITNPYLTFYHFMCGSGYSPLNTLAIETWNGTAWVGVDTLQQGSNSWVEFNYDLTGYTFGTNYLKVRFRANPSTSSSTFYGDQALDDISITQLPSCFSPSSVSAVPLTFTSASLSWVENNSATSWQIEYGTSGFTPGTGTSVITSSNPHTLSSLTAETDYDFYVRSICVPGDTSNWSSGSFFTGYCLPAPSSVDNNGIVNVSFSTVNNTTSTETNNYGDYSTMIGDVGQGVLIPVDITYETGYTYDTKIFVDWNNDLDFDDAGEEVYTGMSTNANPTTLNASFVVPVATPLGQYRMRIGGVDVGPPTPCYTGTYGSYEDYTLNVVPPPSCYAPTALSAGPLTSTSAQLNWTENNGATAWQIQYGVTGFTLGTGTIVNTSSNPYPLSSLTADTDYDFYVRTVCGPGDTSLWTSSSFYTGYCFPAPSSVDGNGITNVSFSTVNNTTGTETNNYGNYSVMVGNAYLGGVLAVDITYETGYTYDTEIYVDWNNDLDFNDVGENVYSGVSLSSNPTTLNASFVVPASTPLGQYRMRIGGADSGPTTPCYTGAYGSFEDYTINVVPCVTSFATISESSCITYTVPSGNATYTASGTYNDTIPNAIGCDSVMTINLTITTPTSATISESSCVSYTVPSGSNTYTTSGTYFDVIPNANGCDSSLTINLTIYQPTTAGISDTVCDAYTVPSGNATYTANGVYYDTITNSNGCDSLITIFLTILPVDVSVNTPSVVSVESNASGATYQWLDCNSGFATIAGETNALYTASANGSYAVEVNQYSCTDTSVCTLITEVGIGDFFKGQVQIYPNPSDGNVNIDFGSLTDVSIEVVSVTGQVVYSGYNINNTPHILNLNAVPGMYSVVVRSEGQEERFKLIIQ